MSIRISAKRPPFFMVLLVRNTYILFNFGDFVDGSADNVADPYIQLLSVNDKSQNHADFVNARLNGKGDDSSTHSGSSATTTSTDTSTTSITDSAGLERSSPELSVLVIVALVMLLGPGF